MRSWPSGLFPRQGWVYRSFALALVAFVAGVFLLGLAFTPQAQAAASYNSEELAFVKLLNEYRASKGLPALLLSDCVSLAAERHASDMGKYAFFSHTTERSDWFKVGATSWDRMAACGYTYSGLAENIGAGQATASQVIAAWKGSSGHNQNLLNAQAKVVGIGFMEVSGSPYRYYWVADFGAVADSSAHPPGGTTDPGTTTTRYQQTDSRFGFAGTWYTFSTSGASAGSYKRTSSNSAEVTVKFTGTYLAWIATKGTTLGKAFVSLDGGPAVKVDLYRSSVAYQQKVWNTGTLPQGAHTVKIWRDPGNATGEYISVDAFDIIGTVDQAPVLTRYQQTDSRFAYSGTWTAVSTSSASGGSFRYANKSGSSMTVTFSGTYLAWIAKKSPVYGMARVIVDGGSPVTVDLYNSSTLWRAKAWTTGTLSLGTHTVKIEWTGQKRSVATGTNISIDAFDILGTPK